MCQLRNQAGVKVLTILELSGLIAINFNMNDVIIFSDKVSVIEDQHRFAYLECISCNNLQGRSVVDDWLDMAGHMMRLSGQQGT